MDGLFLIVIANTDVISGSVYMIRMTALDLC